MVRTVVRRVEDTGSNINSQFKDEANYFEWFSSALTNGQMLCVDTAQLFSIPGGNASFEVTEELACMNRLHGTATNRNISKEIEKTLIQYNISGIC